MRYHEITQTVIGSSPDDWILLRGGPLYLDSLIPITEDGRCMIEADSHTNLAVYKADVDLRLAWGLEDDGALTFEGVSFPEPKITRVLVDGFWRGALVARWSILVADGGQCYLPDLSRAVARTGDSPSDYETFGWTANESDVALARLLHVIVGKAEAFDRCLQQAGIIAVPDGHTGTDGK